MELNKTKKIVKFKIFDQAFSNHRDTCEAIIEKLLGEELIRDTGLYLATPNAGMMPSVQFWSLALEQEPGFMSPKEFPWTLANAPAAKIALGLNLNGPNFTFLGDESALIAAKEQARWDLEDGIVQSTIVVGVKFAKEAAEEIEIECYLS